MYGLILVTFTMATCVVGDLMRIQPLILGGKETTIEDAPFMALYQYVTLSVQGLCGGVIVSERFVLSAAHCYQKPEYKYYVLVGTAISEPQRGGRLLTIEKTIIHPLYNSENNDYDVLVLKLRGKLDFNSRIKPIKMADPQLVIREGAILETFGFGETEYGSTKYLHKVSIPYVNQNICSLFFNPLTDRMICAGSPGKASYKGDSGGPLIYGNILVGLVSFGRLDATETPSVYARVSRLRGFIDDVMENM